MKMPRENQGWTSYARYGRYVLRRLRKAKRSSAEQDMKDVHHALKGAGRTWEDAAEEIQDALADRDAADHDLDIFAREARMNLANRSLDAIRKEPYAAIFGEGIEFWTASPLEQQAQRYKTLGERLVQHLDAADPLRAKAAELPALIQAYEEARAAVSQAQATERERRAEFERHRDRWRTFVERLHGALVADLGRAEAEMFFPKERKTAVVDDEE